MEENKTKKFAIYNDTEAGPWQGMRVGHAYEILEVIDSGEGVPWYVTRMGLEKNKKTRATSSACFGPMFEEIV